MKIPEKVKDEIVRELDRMRQRAVASMNACPKGQSSWIYDKGRAIGLSTAICVINSWNDPEHGKVVARPA